MLIAYKRLSLFLRVCVCIRELKRTDFQFIIRLLIFHKWKNKYVIVKNALKA